MNIKYLEILSAENRDFLEDFVKPDKQEKLSHEYWTDYVMGELAGFLWGLYKAGLITLDEKDELGRYYTMWVCHYRDLYDRTKEV